MFGSRENQEVVAEDRMFLMAAPTSSAQTRVRAWFRLSAPSAIQLMNGSKIMANNMPLRGQPCRAPLRTQNKGDLEPLTNIAALQA